MENSKYFCIYVNCYTFRVQVGFPSSSYRKDFCLTSFVSTCVTPVFTL
uniref:Uncharacterized protein n=1 Tax=Rhizophora mucronata TaxID=61149 RepID=A0A2P2PBN0_RHIMU